MLKFNIYIDNVEFDYKEITSVSKEKNKYTFEGKNRRF